MARGYCNTSGSVGETSAISSRNGITNKSSAITGCAAIIIHHNEILSEDMFITWLLFQTLARV